MSFAQIRGENFFSHKWLFDISTPIGMFSQEPIVNFTPNFPNAINTKFDNLKITPGFSSGLDLEFGCYFGNSKLYGIGTGIIYQYGFTQLSLDNYHVEYKATDANNSVFRQLVTSTKPINENLQNTLVNIPIVFKIKELLTKKIGFSLDAGLIISIYNKTYYSSNGSFDYEAIYSYVVKNNDNYYHIYDNNPIPLPGDWLITQQEIANHNGGNLAAVKTYFDSLSARGYNVGLGLTPTQNTGNKTNPAGSLGFIFRPAVNIKLIERLYVYFGGFVSYQIINNPVDNNYRLIDNYGSTYTTLLGAIPKINNLTYGANIGLRVFLGHSSIYIPRED